jgi:hypothetical protein
MSQTITILETIFICAAIILAYALIKTITQTIKTK